MYLACSLLGPRRQALPQTRRMPGPAGRLYVGRCVQPAKAFPRGARPVCIPRGCGRVRTGRGQSVLFPVTRRGGSGWLFPAVTDVTVALFCIFKPVDGRVKLSGSSCVTEFGRVVATKRFVVHAPVLSASLSRKGHVMAREANRLLVCLGGTCSCGS